MAGDGARASAAARLAASAPSLVGATGWAVDLRDWGRQPGALPAAAAAESASSGRLLFKGPEGRPECGLWICTPGRWTLEAPADELCHFVAGRAVYRRADGGETIEVRPGAVVHFRKGWRGECEVTETIRNLYMLV